MTSVVIKGQEYVLTNEPVHGVVRFIKNKQKEISLGFLLKYSGKLSQYKDKPVEEAMRFISEEDPKGVAEYHQSMEEFIEMSVISLATGRLWTPDDFFNLKETEYKEIIDACRLAVGGTLQDFFGISLMNSNSPASAKNENDQSQKPSPDSSTRLPKEKLKRGKRG